MYIICLLLFALLDCSPCWFLFLFRAETSGYSWALSGFTHKGDPNCLFIC